MITVVNFSHPFTPEQQEALREAIGEFELREVPVQYDMDRRDLPAQARGFVQKAGLLRGQADVLVRYPALAGELMLAVLVGWLGYMPPQVVIKADTRWAIRAFRFSHVENLEQACRLSR